MSPKSWMTVTLAIFIIFCGGCKINLDHASCPCIKGWMCCEESQQCIPENEKCPSQTQVDACVPGSDLCSSQVTKDASLPGNDLSLADGIGDAKSQLVSCTQKTSCALQCQDSTAIKGLAFDFTQAYKGLISFEARCQSLSIAPQGLTFVGDVQKYSCRDKEACGAYCNTGEVAVGASAWVSLTNSRQGSTDVFCLKLGPSFILHEIRHLVCLDKVICNLECDQDELLQGFTPNFSSQGIGNLELNCVKISN